MEWKNSASFRDSTDSGMSSKKKKGNSIQFFCVRLGAAVRERSPIKPTCYLVEILYADGLNQDGMKAFKECNPRVSPCKAAERVGWHRTATLVLCWQCILSCTKVEHVEDAHGAC